MFGYVRPALGRLSQEEQRQYQALYCGLCSCLGERYGFVSRFILNYDFTFLAALLASPATCGQCRCPANPFKKQTAICDSGALELAADCSVILTYYKVLDEIADSGFFRRQACRVLKGLLYSAHRRASARRRAFEEATGRQMARLASIEKERCAILDEPADTFAMLLESVSLEVEDPVQRRVLSQLLYHLGRWIYLVDALDDLEKDAAEGNYNPIALRFDAPSGKLSEQERELVAATLDASIRQMAAAFELGDFGPWKKLVESTVYEGLYCVGHAVLEGTFHAADWRLYFGGKKEQL